ncbi:hypothetical protein D3C81_1992460 [compost metagenome]
MIRVLQIAAATALLASAACATTDSSGVDARGWTGRGAQPFDAAHSACLTAAGDASSSAFTACMAEKGWTRP